VKVLFLHGLHSVPGGVKPTHFIRHGHEVINPALPDDDFDAAVRLAQAEFDHHRPDVIVGSSRGGAIAMAIRSDRVPLVLLCPAWKRWGAVRVAKPNTTILHSRNDEVIPFVDSEELVAASGLPRTALIETGNDHRLADPDSLRTMLDACLRATEGLFLSNLSTRIPINRDV
jgi:Alpha/beta hydrolase family